MAKSNLLVNDRVADLAVSTFVSEVTKNLPNGVSKTDPIVDQVKDDAWGVVCSRHPVTRGWRDEYNVFMNECKGLYGLKQYNGNMSENARLWRGILSGAGGAMNVVYKQKNVTPKAKAKTRKRTPKKRNARSVNRARGIMDKWLENNDHVPSTRILAHFTLYDSLLWANVLRSLRDDGYEMIAANNGYDIVNRPATITIGKDDLVDYIFSLPRDEKIELVARMLSD
jgi:hypothetical protein